MTRTSAGGTTTTYSSQAGNLPSTLTLGDVVTVQSTVVLDLEGENLRGDLTVDGSAVATAFGTAVPGTFEIARVSGPELPEPQSSTSTSRTWRVSEAHDDAVVTIRSSFTVPLSRSGAAEANGPTANWWRSDLQGRLIPASSLSITLDQVRS